jgi:tellurium resistance protein TerD
MNYRITGTDGGSGGLRAIDVEADTEVEAVAIARARGFVVRCCFAYPKDDPSSEMSDLGVLVDAPQMSPGPSAISFADCVDSDERALPMARSAVSFSEYLDPNFTPDDSPEHVRCPKCRSTQVTANTQGFGLGKAAVGGILLGPVGLLGGLIGSNTITITCLQCGHRWKPGN